MKEARLLDNTSIIVRSYVSHNRIEQSDLLDLIVRIHACLSALATGQTRPSKAQIAASVRRNRIVSFIDGKAYKSLTWHLALHGMTPDAYRREFGLPETYPMVAPAYDKINMSSSLKTSSIRRFNYQISTRK